jgi:hypothetical protein
MAGARGRTGGRGMWFRLVKPRGAGAGAGAGGWRGRRVRGGLGGRGGRAGGRRGRVGRLAAMVPGTTVRMSGPRQEFISRHSGSSRGVNPPRYPGRIHTSGRSWPPRADSSSISGKDSPLALPGTVEGRILLAPEALPPDPTTLTIGVGADGPGHPPPGRLVVRKLTNPAVPASTCGVRTEAAPNPPGGDQTRTGATGARAAGAPPPGGHPGPSARPGHGTPRR